MDENEPNIYKLQINEENFDDYFKQDNIYRGAFLQEELNHKIIGENLNSKEIFLEKNILDENNFQFGIYSDCNDEYLDLDINNDNKINNNEIKNLELNQNKNTTTCHIDNVNGKQIVLTNDMISNKLAEYFKTSQMDIETIKEMQMLKKKKERRTNDQIKLDKILNPEIKTIKSRGRHKKDCFLKEKLLIKHPKDADDNLAKKINTFYMEQIRNWLNKSFLDENMNFISDKFLKKGNVYYFFKLAPKLITTKIKKNSIIEVMKKKFKDIYTDYPVSDKYKSDKDHNKKLINKIFEEANQLFVIFILEMTFIEGMNYFCGQISDENIINNFKLKNKNNTYDDKLIIKFIQNFKKITAFVDKLHKENKGKTDDNEMKNYIQKACVLCLNFQDSFEKKYNRKESRKLKKEDSNAK